MPIPSPKLHGMLLLIVFCSPALRAQADSGDVPRRLLGINAGLGVSVVDAPDVVDYINLRFAPSSRLDDFATAAEFFAAAEVQWSDSWGAKLEYAYLLKSYEIPVANAAPFSFSYGIHMPTLMAQYLILGEGYALKLGFGAGVHLARFTEEASIYGQNDYRSTGLGIKLEGEANTEFDEHLYGSLTGDIRDEFMSALHDAAGSELTIPVKNRAARMSLFTLGLKFGLIYYF